MGIRETPDIPGHEGVIHPTCVRRIPTVSLVKCPDKEFLFKIQGETPPVAGTSEQTMKNQLEGLLFQMP